VVRAAMARLKLFRAKISAVARPMPLVPPVMMQFIYFGVIAF